MAILFVDSTATGAGDGSSWTDAWTTIDAAMNDVTTRGAGPHTYLVTAGPYAESPTIDTAGTATAPITFQGDDASGGSGVGAVEVITIDATSITNGLTGPGSNFDLFYVFKNFIFDNADNHGVSLGSNDVVTFKNCTFSNNGNKGVLGRQSFSFERCSSTGNSGIGFDMGSVSFAVGCVASGNTRGFILTAGGIAHCLCFNNTEEAFEFTSNTNSIRFIVNCTVDGNGDASDSGIEMAGLITHGVVANCIIYDCLVGLTMGQNVGELHISMNNLLNANGTRYNNAATFTGEVTDAPLFTTEGSDYSLQSGSPAKAAGFDAGELIGDGTSYVDIGAIQRQEPTGGGGATRLVNGVLAG